MQRLISLILASLCKYFRQKKGNTATGDLSEGLFGSNRAIKSKGVLWLEMPGWQSRVSNNH